MSLSRFPCPFCPKTYSILSKLESHLRTHTGERPFSCHVCSKSFKEKGTLLTHFSTHTKVRKSYKCSQCPAAFSIPRRLQTHLIEVHNMNNLPNEECKTCGKVFRKGKKMKGHVLRCHTQTERQRECFACEKSFKTLQSLENHIKVHTGERPFPCPNCPARFVQRGQRTSHLARKHGVGVRLKCPVCNKNMGGNADLEVHMRTHTNEKPFSCTMCPKTFSTHGNLKTHGRVHGLEKRFSCSICEKRYSSPSAYKAHCLRHTEQTLRYPCGECSLSFYTTWKLKAHVDAVHRQIRRYSCNLCEKSFQSNANRDRHINTHLKETPYKCEICGKSFGYAETFKTHVKHVHSNSEERFQCTKCTFAFKTETELLRHYLKVHVGSGDDVLNCFFCEYRGCSLKKLEFHFTKHTRERPFFCTVCPSSFGSSDNLNSHMQRLHPAK